MRLTTVVLAFVFGFALFLFTQVGAWGQAGDAPPGGAVEAEDGEVYAAARLVVTYEEGAPEAAEEGAVEEVEGKVQEEIAPLDAEVVALPEVADEQPGEARQDALEQARQELESEPGVEEVSFDYLRRPTYTPNDAGFPEQYGLKKPGFPQAWGSSRGDDGDGVRIAVVDTGIDAGHPDLRGKVAAQRDFVDGDGIAEDDAEGHGTHVAGIAAAATNNRAGIAGGCPTASSSSPRP
ncbi:S8 family serine peptidase [Rubrobacter marinus]|uniref:S8 family serine peptidase n=1 Tax=Rubrobacter marinus TaxID=2653852 RepID=A0A6G8Q127_9ACTN|nr:S8 family serine peptidase [Rubrobacter marinus]